MTEPIPLIWPHPSERVVVWRKGTPISISNLLVAAEWLAEDLPDRSHVVNACATRSGFLVSLLAALLRNQVTVLPNDRTARVASQLQGRYPELYCLSEEGAAFAGFEMHAVSAEIPATGSCGSVPSLPADVAAVIAFTSGSTGEPEPNEKSLRVLSTTSQLIARRFQFEAGAPPALLATVPSQHMYGLETAVGLALWSSASVHDLRPLYPADIASALSELPSPRVLVTTPIHLRGLLASSIELPALGAVISATAPLSLEVAHAVEQRFETEVFEIYGFSEAGTVATRRPVADPVWQTCDGLTLRREAATYLVEAAHYAAAVPFSDRINVLAPDRFELIGRANDMINIAGKRASLSGLNAILTEIDNVNDGAFYLADEEDDGTVARLMAFVVAPKASPERILEALRGSIDPAFVPRQIHKVAVLPRLETGKLPRSALATLAERVRKSQ